MLQQWWPSKCPEMGNGNMVGKVLADDANGMPAAVAWKRVTVGGDHEHAEPPNLSPTLPKHQTIRPYTPTASKIKKQPINIQ